MVKILVRGAVRFRIPLTALIVALTVLATSHFVKNFTNSDNSLPVWFEADDPAYLRYRNLVETFGPDRLVFIALEFDNPFSAESLALIERVTRAVERIPDVEKVTSLVNAQVIDGTEEEIRIHPFIEKIPSDGSPGEEELGRKAFENEDFVGNLISEDGKSAAIVARIRTNHTTD